MKNRISEYLEDSISDTSKSIKNNLNESINKLYELSKLDTNTREKIESSRNQISNLTNQLENLSIDMLKGISAINHPFEITIITNYDSLISELDNFNNDFVELENLIDRLQKIIPDFRNIKK